MRPGEPGDYHYVLQMAASLLWNLRAEAVWAPQEVERLCWLDIGLIRAHPSIILDVHGHDRQYLVVLAYRQLVELYEREGYLYEALAVAEEGTSVGQQNVRLEEMRQRVALLEAEDAN